jgi:hypothetical protein
MFRRLVDIDCRNKTATQARSFVPHILCNLSKCLHSYVFKNTASQSCNMSTRQVPIQQTRHYVKEHWVITPTTEVWSPQLWLDSSGTGPPRKQIAQSSFLRSKRQIIRLFRHRIICKSYADSKHFLWYYKIVRWNTVDYNGHVPMLPFSFHQRHRAESFFKSLQSLSWSKITHIL